MLHDTPAPIQFILGILQWMAGVCIAFPAGVMLTFPVTAPLGKALMKPAGQICYFGGANMGAGLVGSFKLFGNAMKSGVQAGNAKARAHQAARQQQLNPFDE